MAEPGTRYSQARLWYKGDKSVCAEEDSQEQDKYGYKQVQKNFNTRGGTSSPLGAQRMAASSSISGVQSLICWADQLGKQTKCKEISSLSNGKAKTASQEIDSVDSLPGQANKKEMHQLVICPDCSDKR